MTSHTSVLSCCKPSKHHHHHHHHHDDASPTTPVNELYPVVHDLSEAEYDTTGACGCGETFGSFQLSDLVLPVTAPSPSLYWNALCPCNKDTTIDDNVKPNSSITQEDIGSSKVEISKNDNDTNTNSNSSVLKNGHQKKDSIATVATAATTEEFAPTTTTTTTTTTDAQGTTRQTQITASGSFEIETKDIMIPVSERSPTESNQTTPPMDNTSMSHHNNINKTPSTPARPLRKKKNGAVSTTKHLRRKSRQLMNIVLRRSNSMGSLFSNGKDKHEDEEEPQQESTTYTEDSTSLGSHTAHARMEQRGGDDPLLMSQCNQLQPNQHPRCFTDTYILTHKVFNCEYSEIWECLHRKSGVRYCVKVWNHPTDQDYMEMDMLQFLTLEQEEETTTLSQLVDLVSDPVGGKTYAVMELAAGGNLLSKVVQDGPLLEDHVQILTRSILEGCRYLHRRRIVHGDLNPENILLRAGHDLYDDNASQHNKKNVAVLCDFGSAVNLHIHDPYGSQTFCNYGAPEVMQAVVPFSEPADMWSVGCLVYFMLTGFSPFDETPYSKRKTVTKISRAEYHFPSHISRSAKQFIANLIAVDQSVRMTAEEALEHPWLRVDEDHDEERDAHHHRRGSSFFHSRRHHSSGDLMADESAKSHHTHRTNTTFHNSLSPHRKSSKKHNRKLSGLTKGISKLFSPTTTTTKPTEHTASSSLALSLPASPDHSELFVSSTLSSFTDCDEEPVVPTPRGAFSGHGATMTEGTIKSNKKKSRHQRRLTCG